jgi:hypothetical protein
MRVHSAVDQAATGCAQQRGMAVKTIKTTCIGLALAMSFAFAASGMAFAVEPGQVVISLYYVAPGKQVEFLKWAAEQAAVDKEVGIPAGQWYAHTDGDAWDYLGIRSVTTAEQDKKSDEAMKKRGMKVGLAAGVVLRQYISRHTDTYAIGPLSAAEMLKQSTQ